MLLLHESPFDDVTAPDGFLQWGCIAEKEVELSETHTALYNDSVVCSTFPLIAQVGERHCLMTVLCMCPAQYSSMADILFPLYSLSPFHVSSRRMRPLARALLDGEHFSTERKQQGKAGVTWLSDVTFLHPGETCVLLQTCHMRIDQWEKCLHCQGSTKQSAHSDVYVMYRDLTCE